MIDISKLEDRFSKPVNWQKTDVFNPETKHNIHFEYSEPVVENKGLIVALPGLSEFCEKYYETARFFANQGYDFLVIDWAYQGRSTRFAQNPHKRHSDGYETDISDLKFIVDQHINQNTTLFLLGHSMGGNIGLRFLLEHPDYFKAASFTAPMLGIKDLKHTDWLISLLKPAFNIFKDSYIPGGRNWREAARKSDGSDIFSSDPIRDKLHNLWCLYDPALQVGNPTIKWILESLSSISFLEKNYEQIETPILLAIAELEEIVSNQAIEKAEKVIPNAGILNLKKSNHEILMEADDIRDEFLNETLKLFKQSV